ncbi:MAG: hypothetical protein J6W10_04830, partial [Kiritimatiellae bacterium]|nr:hypothetical protein [Kiritimatiellia bacterium]
QIMPESTARATAAEITAATQEDSIDWQTQSLEATIMRDDSSDHNWKYVGAGQATEAAAAALIAAKLA